MKSARREWRALFCLRGTPTGGLLAHQGGRTLLADTPARWRNLT